MRSFVITTESNTDLSDEYIVENRITVIPHYYTVEEETYGADRHLPVEEFYEAMRAQKKVATMASNPAVIFDTFTEFAREGKDILHISFSSALSGGCGNVMAGAREVMEEYPEIRIEVVDTLSASLGEGILINLALVMQKEGKSLEETARALRDLVPNICVQFTVDDLNHLYRGGRLSKTTAIVGTLAGIKPILYIDDAGKLVALGKARGRKKSMVELVNNMEVRLGAFRDRQQFIGIVHGDCDNDAQELADLIRERFGYTDFMIRPIGPSIGAHSGPGALGIIFLGDHR